MPDPTPPAPSPARFAALDGLRGLAALMVALSHYVLAFQPALLGGGPRVAHFDAAIPIAQTSVIALYNPELGVAIFFVLSGFVLAASVARSRTGLAELVLRRWARLALPVLGTSLLIWPLAEWHWFRSVEAAPLAKSDWLAGNYAWLAFETNDLGRLVWMSLVDLFARSRHFYNAALWTMPTEFRGSVALFAAYAALRASGLRSTKWAAAIGLAAALLVVGAVWNTLYFGFPCGVALFEARRLLAGRRGGAGAAGGVLLIMGILLGGMPYSIDLAFGGLYAHLYFTTAAVFDHPVSLMHGIGAVCLVGAALLSVGLQAVLEGRVCRYLGRISFMLYLVHVPLLCSAVAAAVLIAAPRFGYNAAAAVLLPLFLASTILLATICTWAIDEPAQRLARRIGRLPAGLVRTLRARAARA